MGNDRIKWASPGGRGTTTAKREGREWNKRPQTRRGCRNLSLPSSPAPSLSSSLPSPSPSSTWGNQDSRAALPGRPPRSTHHDGLSLDCSLQIRPTDLHSRLLPIGPGAHSPQFSQLVPCGVLGGRYGARTWLYAVRRLSVCVLCGWWASGLPGCTCNLFLCLGLLEGGPGTVRRIEKGIVTVRPGGRQCEGPQP